MTTPLFTVPYALEAGNVSGNTGNLSNITCNTITVNNSLDVLGTTDLGNLGNVTITGSQFYQVIRAGNSNALLWRFTTAAAGYTINGVIAPDSPGLPFTLTGANNANTYTWAQGTWPYTVDPAPGGLGAFAPDSARYPKIVLGDEDWDYIFYGNIANYFLPTYGNNDLEIMVSTQVTCNAQPCTIQAVALYTSTANTSQYILDMASLRTVVLTNADPIPSDITINYTMIVSNTVNDVGIAYRNITPNTIANINAITYIIDSHN